jgi:hypothetical protein
MLTTLGNALKGIEELPWQHAFYLPVRSDWSENSECGIFDPDDVDDDAETPAAAEERGLKYALDVATVRDVFLNLREQGAVPELPLLFEAVCHYYDHDAFLVIR